MYIQVLVALEASTGIILSFLQTQQERPVEG
jgi:hypothetical protein